jgi:Uma2 family endonuclease
MELATPSSSRCSISVQEYFRLAEASPTKLEYKAGQIIDMAGASYVHTQIAADLMGELRNRLKRGPCRATGSDTRVRVAHDRYCYPDITVVCGEPEFDPLNPGQTIINPKVVFEVLSPTTEIDDRGEKFFRYIRLPSLREYFLVAQTKLRIESFVRMADGSWSVGAVEEGLDAALRIQSLEIEVPLKEIYANVKFEPEPTGQGH